MNVTGNIKSEDTGGVGLFHGVRGKKVGGTEPLPPILFEKIAVLLTADLVVGKLLQGQH